MYETWLSAKLESYALISFLIFSLPYVQHLKFPRVFTGKGIDMETIISCSSVLFQGKSVQVKYLFTLHSLIFREEQCVWVSMAISCSATNCFL